jgi:hypothetical protein
MNRFVCGMRMALVLLVTGIWLAAGAQALRDPTQAPPAALSGPEGAPASDLPFGDEGVAVVVRGGKPFLVSGTRLYGVGQTVGKFRIERISETEVWLRQGTDLRKIPRFAGIQRRESRPVADCAAVPKQPPKSSSVNSSTSPKAAPCAGAQS